MNPTGTRNATASAIDADGVRVQRVDVPGGASRRRVVPVMALAGIVGALVLLMRSERSAPPAVSAGDGGQVTLSFDERGGVAEIRATSPATPVAPVRRPQFTPAIPADISDPDFSLPSSDPDDLASHFRPGDAEPTMTELIEALRASGVREGIAAFNPPGTRPLLAGIAVPPDFELPPGYVRHHQVTDQGVDIEPVLMFAPDVQFFDEQGHAIAIPENRIVPPELAPPGLPIRPVELPPEDGP